MNLGTLILLVLVLAGMVIFFWLWSRTWNRTGSAGLGRPRRPSRPGRGSRIETLPPPEPPYTKSDGMVAPKFGSAGSGGAEHEPVGERRNR